MKICHIVEAAGGGSGQVVLDLVKYGATYGDEITLVYSPDRVDERFLKGIKNFPENTRVFTANMRRKVGLHDLRDAWNLYHMLRNIGPFDIIHSHSSKAGALSRIVGIFMGKAKQIYTPHAFMTLAPNASPVYGWVEWALCWFCDIIIAVSKQEAEHAIKHLKIPSRKIQVIPNGIELNYPATRESARAIMGYKDTDKVVGFVGRLVPQKNPLRLVEAFSMASKTLPEIKLAIVGDGALREETEKSITRLDLTENVKFFRNHSGRDLMPGFDCLLCTSDYEGFAVALLEALAAGVPIVTSPVGGADEAVIEGVTGYMTADFSSTCLSEKLVKICELKPDKMVKMNAATKKHAAIFSISDMVKNTRSLYLETLNERAEKT